MKPLENESTRTVEDVGVAILIVLGIVLALLLRYALLDFESLDYKVFLSRWYDFIRARGFPDAFKHSFSNYTPLYLYLLAVATLLPISKLHAIKLVSVVFDFVAATIVYRIVKEKYPASPVPIYAFLALLFAPTVFLNSALWGQCDVLYSSMTVASLYCIIRSEYDAALVLYGLSFSLKLQSMFVLPVYVLLWIKRELAITKFLYIPLVYFMTIVPSLAAGRPLLDLLGIYLHQTEGRRLSMQAPNLYQWFPRREQHFSFLNPAGLVLTVFIIVILFFIIHLGLRKRRLDVKTLIQTSLLSALVVPFFLPQMHERYFFLADVLSIVYAFYFPKHFFVPIIVILSSLFSYLPFLFGGSFIELSYLALLLFGLIVFITHDLITRIHANESRS